MQDLLKQLFDYDKINGGLIWKIKHSDKVIVGKKYGFVESGNKPYIKGMINGKTYREHRLVWIWHNGNIPNNLVIDHINRNHSDNRIQNLRMVTQKVNLSNKKNSKKSLPKYLIENFL